MIKLKIHYLNLPENKIRILFKLFLTLILGTQVCLSAFAQNGEITGKIVDRKTILVTNEKVSNPVAVRYAWRNFVEASLFDNNLLPISSFRTDNWNDATHAENK